MFSEILVGTCMEKTGIVDKKFLGRKIAAKNSNSMAEKMGIGEKIFGRKMRVKILSCKIGKNNNWNQ